MLTAYGEAKLKSILDEVKAVMKGKDEVIRTLMCAILAQGHILIDDIPGVGKTTLAMAFSRAMGLDNHRLQFTPDVMPSDVVGFSVLNNDGNLEYKQGVVICNLFLADEINRTSSKTQSALLEAMEERRVTIEGVTRELPKPFVVIATQNPVGSIGTQMLPESQLDRFMVQLTMGYPNPEDEIRMMRERQGENPLYAVKQAITKDELLKMQESCRRVKVKDEVLRYITELAQQTRISPLLELGVSPRGSLAICDMAKAMAFMESRDYVVPEDVRAIWLPVTRHRVLRSGQARIAKKQTDTILTNILESVPIPRPRG